MSDDALLNEFNRGRSERAFEALVQRHLRLVFATALRQVGDRSLAEEISQQVFLALARKAGRLGGHQTIAGWLYQTTLREAKRALRTQLRRQRRDQLALEVGALGHGGADEADGLLPLLDEALASLRESERLAVILRYFEGKSWREVGTALGASEDAVQKRGERALETLGRFFARHGFKVSAAALTNGLTTQASAAVPVTLAGVIAQTALAPAASASTAGVLAMHLMNLTKTQTTVATLLVCAAPIAYEVNAKRESEAEMRVIQEQLTQATIALEGSISTRDLLAQDLEAIARMLADLAHPLPVDALNITVPEPKPATPEPVGWQDDLPYIEVPKGLLKEITIPTLDDEGRLKDEIIDALAMSHEEFTEVQNVLNRELRAWRNWEGISARFQPSYKFASAFPDEQGETLAYRFPALAEQGAEIKQRLDQGIIEALGDERGRIFLSQAGNSLATLFRNFGQREQLVVLVRTGNLDYPVLQISESRDTRQNLIIQKTRITVGENSKPENLHLVPEVLRSLALRWYYQDM